MPLRSHDYRGEHYDAYSEQGYDSRRYDRYSRRNNLQKTYSDNRYDRHVRYSGIRNDYDDWNEYKGGRNRHEKRHRGGADNDMDDCDQLIQNLSCKRGNRNNGMDFCSPERDYVEQDRYQSRRARCEDRDTRHDPREDGYGRRQCDNDRCGCKHRDRYRDSPRSRPSHSRSRSNHDYDDDFNRVCEQPRDEPTCEKAHKVPHCCCKGIAPTHTLKSCLAYKSKHGGGGDGLGGCCSYDSCPFCLLRTFCAGVLQELAEIKAKQLGGKLEGLVYDPEGYKKLEGEQKPDSAVSLAKKTKSFDVDRCLESLEDRHHRFSDDDMRRRRGRDYSDYSRDSMRSKRRRGSYDSLDRDRCRSRDRNRDRDSESRHQAKKCADKKKQKQEALEEKPVELPEDVKQELERARIKAERARKKKEAEKAKKAMIEKRLQQSRRFATKCKAFALKPYTGPGRFAEVNICDFLKLRLESMFERDAAMQKSLCFQPPCAPIFMPPVCSLNPNYCCTSFWCPQPTVPAICC